MSILLGAATLAPAFVTAVFEAVTLACVPVAVAVESLLFSRASFSIIGGRWRIFGGCCSSIIFFLSIR